jgi:hypothetical protein
MIGVCSAKMSRICCEIAFDLEARLQEDQFWACRFAVIDAMADRTPNLRASSPPPRRRVRGIRRRQ